MDRSASIRVAPEPLPVRRYRDLRRFTGEQWRLSAGTLSGTTNRCKLKHANEPQVAGSPKPAIKLSKTKPTIKLSKRFSLQPARELLA
jgi:hypothetical protein